MSKIREELATIAKQTAPATNVTAAKQIVDSAYDIEGLKQDFPTAGELQKFVFDTVGISLNLKGRKTELKYQVALDALIGNPIPDEYLTNDHPYVDKSDLIPVDDMKTMPARSQELPDEIDCVNTFHTSMMPHPDPNERAGDLKCDVEFKKYNNGLITYQILGPIIQRPSGSKVDKFGRTRPEKMIWVDPRTPELVLRNANGEYSKEGRGLKLFMEGRGLWRWIDRDFAAVEAEKVINPWA